MLLEAGDHDAIYERAGRVRFVASGAIGVVDVEPHFRRTVADPPMAEGSLSRGDPSTEGRGARPPSTAATLDFAVVGSDGAAAHSINELRSETVRG